MCTSQHHPGILAHTECLTQSPVGALSLSPHDSAVILDFVLPYPSLHPSVRFWLNYLHLSYGNITFCSGLEIYQHRFRRNLFAITLRPSYSRAHPLPLLCISLFSTLAQLANPNPASVHPPAPQDPQLNSPAQISSRRCV